MNRWTLGAFGDMVWDHVPELRPAVAHYMCTRFEMQISVGEESVTDLQPGIPELVTNVIVPELVTPIDQGRADEVLKRRLAGLVRRSIRYDGLSGPELVHFHEEIQLWLLEAMWGPGIDAAMRSVDPEWDDLVGREFLQLRRSQGLAPAFEHRWSIGAFGDLLWEAVPELRESIGDLLCRWVREHVDDEVLPVPGAGDYWRCAVEPRMLLTVDSGGSDQVFVGQMVDLIRLAVNYRGPGRDQLHAELERGFTSRLDVAFWRGALMVDHVEWTELESRFHSV